MIENIEYSRWIKLSKLFIVFYSFAKNKMFIGIITFLLLCSNAVFCDDYCDLNIPYSGLTCNLDLSVKNLTNVLNLVNTGEKFVALTFDDVPSDHRIIDILRILKRHKSKAIFFVLGDRIDRKNTELLKKIHKAGHELANHSWSHKNLTLLSSEDQLQDIEKTNRAIKNAIKQDVKWFRPPFGCYDDNLIKNTNHLNMNSILWTVDSLDWKNDKPEVLVGRVLSKMHNGAIILFHDHDNKSNTAEALPHVIKALKKTGYRFVTLSDWEKRVCKAVKDSGMPIDEGLHLEGILSRKEIRSLNAEL